MTHEIWLTDDEAKKVVFAGDKRALENGKPSEEHAVAVAKFIASSEGKTLRVTDGHEVSHLVHDQQFTEVDR
ncbi:MAG: hypothetical protein JRF62_07450 [Deltaproteobacteria bacterium]|nr:hypothetical protein [Deltaproteobacteria bacterium]MBW2597339.1 hypothetical protein [Deltaproteobacteria bacterium]MBW2639054.1 hypothetical protein [Deltaproteobacteria bacterium]RLC15627.1 MAG: hypothetical protein DRI24_10465 [Deltaproteobacteria bacterium]